MSINKSYNITNMANIFLEPTNATHRQYEALRAYFVDDLPSKEVAKRFGYTDGSFRVMVHQFRKNPQRAFFLSAEKGPKTAPKKDKVREIVIDMRKQNLSIYDISKILKTKGHEITPVSISKILKEEGFAKLPRRTVNERLPGIQATEGEESDVRELDLSTQRFQTKFGGLFLFMPLIASIPFDEIIQKAGFPGSKKIPAGCAMRSLLAMKLYGTARHSHVMSYVLDEGLALFAGLNVIPKRSIPIKTK